MDKLKQYLISNTLKTYTTLRTNKDVLSDFNVKYMFLYLFYLNYYSKEQKNKISLEEPSYNYAINYMVYYLRNSNVFYDSNLKYYKREIIQSLRNPSTLNFNLLGQLLLTHTRSKVYPKEFFIYIILLQLLTRNSYKTNMNSFVKETIKTHIYRFEMKPNVSGVLNDFYADYLGSIEWFNKLFEYIDKSIIGMSSSDWLEQTKYTICVISKLLICGMIYRMENVDFSKLGYTEFSKIKKYMFE